MTRLLALSVLLLSACPKKSDGPTPVATDGAAVTDPAADATAGGPVDAARAPDAPLPGTSTDGEVDLVFTGGVDATVKGNIGNCGYTAIGDKPAGGRWQVKNEEFEFTIAAYSDEQLAAGEPNVIMNVFQPARATYTFRNKGTVKVTADRTLAEIDGELEPVVGKVIVKVKGTMKCPALVK